MDKEEVVIKYTKDENGNIVDVEAFKKLKIKVLDDVKFTEECVNSKQELLLE